MAACVMQKLTFEREEKYWQFPRDRFVIYEKSDESWCRFFGIGYEATRMTTVTGMGIVKQIKRDIVEDMYGNARVVNKTQFEFIKGSDNDIELC